MVGVAEQKPKIHRIHSSDNVATALCELVEGETIEFERRRLLIRARIPFGHKVALVEIPEGTRVVKYGEPIGSAKRCIAAGEHVHVHNVVTLRGIRTDTEE